ncbi:hypothetical protein SAMN04515647_1828 [Cohaesibacter sp. ES.047]|uniref:hypothetical protein n=1 Tax=Cohaesibacter sp. ES.047 TaxID=1798205 RepID=UPI000BC0CBE4|nr:hypothetical protein [Cohaesibacter sp. ES.047]SNY91599.1 hypothetical protein SAMN04515647_1828 [Cohaesibacter sp. ES.047]
MVEIAHLLETDARFPTRNDSLPWGASASHYLDEINAVLVSGDIPVTVELRDDLNQYQLPGYGHIIWVDHHNDRSGHNQETALEQIFTLLKWPEEAWTRRLALVAANDKAHIKGMVELDATEEELNQIRCEDRRAQGVTEADEKQAKQDLRNANIASNCLLVETSLDSSTAIADLFSLDLEPNKASNLLVLMPNKSAFFGEGLIVVELAKAIEGSWYGGNLPEIGFWGSYETNKTRLLNIVEGAASLRHLE